MHDFCFVLFFLLGGMLFRLVCKGPFSFSLLQLSFLQNNSVCKFISNGTCRFNPLLGFWFWFLTFFILNFTSYLCRNWFHISYFEW